MSLDLDDLTTCLFSNNDVVCFLFTVAESLVWSSVNFEVGKMISVATQKMPGLFAVRKRPSSPSGNITDSKVRGANVGPTWGRQNPGGPMLATWTVLSGILSNSSCWAGVAFWGCRCSQNVHAISAHARNIIFFIDFVGYILRTCKYTFQAFSRSGFLPNLEKWLISQRGVGFWIQVLYIFMHAWRNIWTSFQAW